MNKDRVSRFFSVVSLMLLITLAFLAGMIAQKHSLFPYFLGARQVELVLRKTLHKSYSHKPFFYHAPEQESSDIFGAIDVKYPFKFIVYGDSREPALSEKDYLIDKIIEEKPDFVIHLGDMVKFSEEHQWKIFDALEGRIMASGIRMYPVLGNHEYFIFNSYDTENPQERLKPYFRRFSFLGGRRWYAFEYGNSLFIILDSNSDYSPGSNQYEWLMKRLKDSSREFTFIILHHSPYTKNPHKTLRTAEKQLAEVFQEYKDHQIPKPDIVFSAHTHNYERYNYGDIDYIVSGGGGTYQHEIDRGKDDLYLGPGDTFHFCRVSVDSEKIKFEMVKFDSANREWQIVDSFSLGQK